MELWVPGLCESVVTVGSAYIHLADQQQMVVTGSGLFPTGICGRSAQMQ